MEIVFADGQRRELPDTVPAMFVDMFRPGATSVPEVIPATLEAHAGQTADDFDWLLAKLMARNVTLPPSV